MIHWCLIGIKFVINHNTEGALVTPLYSEDQLAGTTQHERSEWFLSKVLFATDDDRDG